MADEDIRFYLQRIQSDAKIAESMLPTPPTDATIDTVDKLNQAFANGGSYRLAASGGNNGVYTGNFVAAKTINLLAVDGATLAPADPLVPTLLVPTAAASNSNFNSLTIQNGGKPDRDCVIVGDFDATSADAQPDGVVFNGVIVRALSTGGKRGFVLHTRGVTVKNCRVEGFYSVFEGQGIWIHNGPGPYTIENNYVEGSGENIMTGGEHIHIANCVPTDVTIRGNVCYKPDSWRPVAGQPKKALVKNSIEIKNGRNVLIENNTCDGCWTDGQSGTPIMLSVRNQYGDTPWAIIDGITVRGNKTVRCKDYYAVNILGWDNNYSSQQTKSVTIEHNLFTDSPFGIIVGNGVAENLYIRNNTMPAIRNSFLTFSDTRYIKGPPMDFSKVVKSPITFMENIVKSGQYGIAATDLGVGMPSLTAYTTMVSWMGNVIEKSAERPGIVYPNPSQNYLLEVGEVDKILDPTTFKLKPGTPYGNAGY